MSAMDDFPAPSRCGPWAFPTSTWSRPRSPRDLRGERGVVVLPVERAPRRQRVELDVAGVPGDRRRTRLAPAPAAEVDRRRLRVGGVGPESRAEREVDSAPEHEAAHDDEALV